VRGWVFVGASWFGGDFTGPSQSSQDGETNLVGTSQVSEDGETRSIPTDKDLTLGGCLAIPRLSPTVDGCEGLTKEQYKHQAQLAWKTLQGLTGRVAKESWPNRPVFAREFVGKNLRWYNCSLDLRNMAKVVSDDGSWLCDAVVSTFTALTSYASIHARCPDGPYKSVCVPCHVLKRERDDLEKVTCRTLRHLLPTADYLFAPVPMPGHFTLIHCDLRAKPRRLMYYYDTLLHERGKAVVSGALAENAAALVSVLDRHGLPTSLKDDWEQILVPHVPQVGGAKELDPPSCPRQVDGSSCGLFVMALVECLVSGRHPKVIANYEGMYNYRKHVVWMLMHWHVHGVWPGYVADWCA
jgi:Ulp1 protease family, C-terminal catalytic domain